MSGTFEKLQTINSIIRTLLALVVVLIWLGVFIGYRSVFARKD